MFENFPNQSYLHHFNWFSIKSVGFPPIGLLCARLTDNDDDGGGCGSSVTFERRMNFKIENAEKLFLRHLHHCSGGRQAVRGDFLLIIIDQTDDEAGNRVFVSEAL